MSLCTFHNSDLGFVVQNDYIKGVCKIVFAGRVVINNSVRGMYTMPGTPAYNASKHALESYADSLRLEMQKFSVKVSIVAPGKFGTATAIVNPEQVNIISHKLAYYFHSSSSCKHWHFSCILCASLTSSSYPALGINLSAVIYN